MKRNTYFIRTEQEECYARHFPQRKTPVRDPRCQSSSQHVYAQVAMESLPTHPCWIASLMNPSLQMKPDQSPLHPRPKDRNKTAYTPLPQRQIRCPRPRAQTLRCAAYNNRDRHPRSGLQDVRARLLANAAHAQREQDVAIERHLEVCRQR